MLRSPLWSLRRRSPPHMACACIPTAFWKIGSTCWWYPVEDLSTVRLPVCVPRLNAASFRAESLRLRRTALLWPAYVPALWLFLRRGCSTAVRQRLDNLRATRAHVIEARVVDDGDILTCGGVTSSLDLALWVVERFGGAETAAVVASDLEYTWTRDVHISGKDARTKT